MNLEPDKSPLYIFPLFWLGKPSLSGGQSGPISLPLTKMTTPGEVIAILGLVERVVIELRNYKDAPVYFQQLDVALDLLCGTLQNVLKLQPGDDHERQILDKIRAIAMHCLQLLQVMVDKMRAKESSLGHFRTAGTLVSIGTCVHWSLIACKDVDDLRKVVLAEMVAINVLLNVLQLYDSSVPISKRLAGYL